MLLLNRFLRGIPSSLDRSLLTFLTELHDDDGQIDIDRHSRDNNRRLARANERTYTEHPWSRTYELNSSLTPVIKSRRHPSSSARSRSLSLSVRVREMRVRERAGHLPVFISVPGAS